MRKNRICFVISLLVLLAVLSAFWIGGLIMSKSGTDTASLGDPVDYVIILGCRVEGETPGKCLDARIDAGAEYLKAHPFAMAVCSGAQGSDEAISEAEAIMRGLTDRGIHKRRILKEENSRSTYENLLFSKQLLDERTAGRSYRVAVLTNNFHIYRARRLAEYVGFVNPASISAKTPATQFYQNLIREICAVVYAHFRYR